MGRAKKEMQLSLKNPKSEIRNKFKSPKKEIQNQESCCFGHLALGFFGFVSDFGFRI
jgi:hypothetical protein